MLFRSRKARDFFFLDFFPKSADDVMALFTNRDKHPEQNAYFRMVSTYWDMAAAMVNNGAISLQFFNDCNGEHIGVFSKIEPLLGEIRAAYGPQFAASLEKLIDATPDGRKRSAESRERMNAIREQLSKAQSSTA